MQDGNIHCHIDNLSRRRENHGARIAVASAAYVCGRRLWSEVEQRHVDFGVREDVVFSEIILPDGAPDWAADRASLWNRVDLTARRKDARLAKTIVAAIARDIPVPQRIELLRAFAAPFVALGCVADIAIHEDGTDHNPHIHILLTSRQLVADGFGDKLTALEQRQFVKQVRQRWANLTNQHLEKAGSALRVDHRSYKARGIESVPTVHRGPDTLERRQKREHARRVREEKIMPKPDLHEQLEYPLLSARETWPPEPEASPDLTRQERDEHHRYWQDRKFENLEEQERIEPEQAVEAQEPERPWYQQALDRARGETTARAVRDQNHREKQPSRGTDRERDQAVYYASLLKRARAMDRGQAELEALDAVRNASPEARHLVEDLILQDRMQAVRDQDRAEMVRGLDPEVREKLDALKQEFRDRELDLPVPGPDRELLHPRELDQAQEQMLENYQRDEQDRDR